MAEAPGVPGRVAVLAAVVAILAVTGLILVGGDAVMRRLGQTGLRIMEKLMGLMVTVIAVQLLMNGLEPFLRGLLAAPPGR